MVKLSHKTIRSKIAEQNWTQEALDIWDRYIRNLCKQDNANIALCYNHSKLFGTTIEELLVIVEADE